MAASIDQRDQAFARNAYAKIAFIRAFEAKCLSLSQTNPPTVAGSMHLCAGQEAVPVGALAALGENDRILATYRGHGWAIASGLDAFSLMAEICHRSAGLNGGRAGSALFTAPNSRFIGETSIVGAGTTMACGVAMGAVARGTGGVVVVSIGDGAMNQGAVSEAFAFASVRRLPVIFVCENNGWSELTATREMFRVERLAQRASGYGMSSATIDGSDPIAVRDSIALAAERCRGGEGPVLVECRVPRLWGHYNRDIEHYRSKEDRAAAQARDPLVLLGARLAASGMLDEAQAGLVRDEQQEAVERLTAQALQSALPDAAEASAHVVAPPRPVVTSPAGMPVTMTYIEAVNAALRTELQADPNVVVYGEDMGRAGGIFGASRNLQRDFGEDRVFDTPIAESAILGSAVGAALSGLKPIVEIMWADFLFVALDALVNQATNIRYVTEGRSCVPMVVRTQQGATPGSCAQHSQSVEAMLAHVPGLKLAIASTPQDAFALIRAAAADPDPCLVMEHRAFYQRSGPVYPDAPIEAVGRARLHRPGTDCAIITWGTMVPVALAAAEELANVGINAAVLDLRWLSPLDEEAIVSTVRGCGGRALVLHEAVRSGGFAGEIAMRLNERLSDEMRVTVRRVTTPDVRMPASPVLQVALLPNAAKVVESVLGLVRGPQQQRAAASA